MRYTRTVESLNDNFYVAEGKRIDDKLFPNSAWKPVTIPHDYAITQPTGKECSGGNTQGFFDSFHAVTYRRVFHVCYDVDRLYWLEFDGVYRNSKIYVNGHLAGQRPYGYISFQIDVTSFIVDGNNQLEVFVDNSTSPGDRWYSGMGIYADIRLVTTSKLYIRDWDTIIQTHAIDNGREIQYTLTVVNDTTSQQTINLHASLRTDTGEICAVHITDDLLLNSGENQLTQSFILESPQLWSDLSPVLYSFDVEISSDDNKTGDTYHTRIGLRDILFDNDKGMLVNGHPVKLKGVNLHHTSGCLGACFYKDVWRSRLLDLKAIGCNAIRTSHNPMPPSFYDLCDEIGLYVYAEIFDKWHWKQGYYWKIFDEWAMIDLSDAVRRDRNHPCIFIWSVGNEVEDQGEDSMLETLASLTARVRELDPTRPVTLAMEPHCNPKEVLYGSMEEKIRRTVAIAQYVDILSCNYQEQWYAAYRETMPDKLIIGTETYHYFTASGNHIDNMVPTNPWNYVRNNTYVVGQFLWAGAEYLGESQTYPSKGCSAAPIDIGGFYRPQAYYQKSIWTQEPMVYAAIKSVNDPYRYTKAAWAFPRLQDSLIIDREPGDLIELFIFSNCENVELLYGGLSYGERRPNDDINSIIDWYLPYSPKNDIVVIGKNGGHEVCRYTLYQEGAPASLALYSDREIQKAGDIMTVRATLVDKKGIPCYNARREVRFLLPDNLELLGIDSGDLCAHFPYTVPQITSYNGHCVLIVRSKDGEATQIRAEIVDETTVSGTLKILSSKCP